ncbi:YiiX family permuted papain-like enzyme [soil metagenome]
MRPLLYLVFSLFTSISYQVTATPQWHDGDIIFQISQSSQCKAVQAATKSPYSHVGIMFQADGKWFVLEAVQPVVYTALPEWVLRGERGHYVVKRLKDTSVLTPTAIACMKEKGQGYLGKNYDATFEWNDDRIYCSELVWKLYKSCTNIEVGVLKKLGDFDLTSPLVATKIKERYGNKVPLDETVISPADMFADNDLVTVFSN